MDAPTTMDIVWTLLAGIVTLAIFSFLYRDNPAYKMAEHIAVGLSVGFLVITYYYNVFKPKLWDNVLHNGQLDHYHRLLTLHLLVQLHHA